MALTEALRLLETPGNPARDVIILTDGQRSAWRPDEPARWRCRVRFTATSADGPAWPRIWVINFAERAALPAQRIGRAARAFGRPGHARAADHDHDHCLELGFRR